MDIKQFLLIKANHPIVFNLNFNLNKGAPLMFGVLKDFYVTLLFKFYCNRQVFLEGDTDLMPVEKTYFTGNDITHHKLKILLNPEEESAEKEQECLKTIFIDDTPLETPKTAVLYIFCHRETSENPIAKYSEIFLDPKILKIKLDASIFHIIKSMGSINPTGMAISIKKIDGYFWSFMNATILLVLSIVFYNISCFIIARLSKMDPIFTDFSIISSNIEKFGNLTEKPTAQCSICYETFLPEEDVRILDCKHYYHPACIDRWLIGHTKRCPCCRTSIEVSEKV